MTSTDTLLPGPSEAELGAHLRVLREALGVDLDELAARCGLDADILRALEGGQHCADVATLRALAAGLGVRLGAIFSLWEQGVLQPSPGQD